MLPHFSIHQQQNVVHAQGRREGSWRKERRQEEPEKVLDGGESKENHQAEHVGEPAQDRGPDQGEDAQTAALKKRGGEMTGLWSTLFILTKT